MKTLTNSNQLSTVSGGAGLTLIAIGVVLSNTASMAYGEGVIGYDTYLTSMAVSSTFTLTGTACLYLEGCRDGKNFAQNVMNGVLDIF